MIAMLGSLRGDLAQAGLDCLEPDLLILDAFQRYRDLLCSPALRPTTRIPRRSWPDTS